MISRQMPVSRRTRSTKWRPLTARRQASVATERARETRRRRNFSAQTESAETARSIAPSESLPEVAMPSPRRTTREKASMTVKPLVGRAARRAGGNCWCRDRSRHRCGGESSGGAEDPKQPHRPLPEPALAEPRRLAAASNGLLILFSFRAAEAAFDLGPVYMRGREAARTGLAALTAQPPLPISRPSRLPRRLTVRLRTLTPSIEVRILAGHPLLPLDDTETKPRPRRRVGSVVARMGGRSGC